MTDKINLEQLPHHELKRACKEKGIAFKTTDKKVDLIAMLRAGETKHKPKEVKRMPNLKESATEKSIPMLPVEIKPQLEELKGKGLEWTINEDDGCVYFKRDIKTCANLDQSARNILMTAQQAFRGKFGLSGLSIEAGNKLQAKNLDNS